MLTNSLIVIVALAYSGHSTATEAFAYVADQEDQLLVGAVVGPVKPAVEPVAVEPDPLKDWENPDQFDAYLVKKGEKREDAKINDQSKKLQKRFKSAEEGAPMVISASKKKSKPSRSPSAKVSSRKISSRK